MTDSASQRTWSHVNKLLQAQRAQLVNDIAGERQRTAAEPFAEVASEVRDRGDASVADLVVDEHRARLERETLALREIDDALERIQAGTYGVCLHCGLPIDRERLEVMPSAKYDLRCMELLERDSGRAKPPTI